MAIDWTPYDRIRETSSSTGTGDITLAGAVAGYLAFQDRYTPPSAKMVACIENASAGEFEVVECTLTAATTLQRDTVLASSNSDLAVNFSAGGLRVFVVMPAEQILVAGAGIDYDQTTEELNLGVGGVITPFTNSRLVIDEGAGSAIMSLLSVGGDGVIMFGDAAANNQGQFGYNHTSDYLYWAADANGTVGAMKLYGGSKLIIGPYTSPDSELHVKPTSAGTVTATAGTVVTVESSSAAYLSFLVPDNTTSGIVMSSPSVALDASILWDAANDRWIVSAVGGSASMYLDDNTMRLVGSTPALEVAIGANAAQYLHIENTSSTVSEIRMVTDAVGAAYLNFDYTVATNAGGYARFFFDSNAGTGGAGVYVYLADGAGTTVEHFIDAKGGQTSLCQNTGSQLLVGESTSPSSLTGKLSVKTTSAEAKPCLELDQNDIDEAFIEFDGTAAASVANPVSTWKSGGNIDRWVRVSSGGTDYWTPLFTAPSSANAVDGFQGVCMGRLTLESGVAIPDSDQANKGTIYFTPYNGDLISLYDGSSAWKLYKFSELTYTIAGASTAGSVHDLFLYDNSGTLTFERVAWTNTTTRATAIVLQDGVWVKSGATERRYLGSFRIGGTANQTDDQAGLRALYNQHNRVPRRLWHWNGNLTGSAYATGGVYRQAGGDSNGRIHILQGNTDEVGSVNLHFFRSWVCATIQAVNIGIGYDGVNPSSNTQRSHNNSNPVNFAMSCHWQNYPGLGWHYYDPLEAQDLASSTTWQYGDMSGFWSHG